MKNGFIEKKKAKRSGLYKNPVQFLSPIKIVLDFDRTSLFKNIKVGETFHFQGRIYKKTKKGFARLIYSSVYFLEFYLKPSERQPLDENLNKDMVGTIYHFDKNALCQYAIIDIKNFGHGRFSDFSQSATLMNSSTINSKLNALRNIKNEFE